MFENFSHAARVTMANANKEAQRLSHEYIGTEHLLLGLLLEPDCAAAQVLDGLGVTMTKIRDEITRLPPNLEASDAS